MSIVPPSDSFNFDSVGFKLYDTNGIIVYTHTDGQWDAGEFRTDPRMDIHVGSSALNYGQSCFEGLKAFRAKDNTVRLFRPQENCKRLNRSAEAIGLPAIPEEMFLDACRRAVSHNLEFVPPYAPGAAKGSLYLRPMLFGSGAELTLMPPTTFSFVVYVSPVGNMYSSSADQPGVDALVLEDFDRSAPRGTGSFKLGGNYAPVFRHQAAAKKAGFGITLHLDSQTRTLIDEFSTSNFVAISHGSARSAATASTVNGAINGAASEVTLVVPQSESILRSITTLSVCAVAEEFGWKVERRPVPFAELSAGKFEEVAAAGTAAIITPVGSVSFTSRALGVESGAELTRIVIGSGKIGPCFAKVLAELKGVQSGDIPDRRGWLWPAAGISGP